ncbi:MAG: cation:proton antiporter, partial [SAR324 cluster bacterium]|nr:cation:proton antiporter [SAR324 cluster bacterium]
MLDRVLFIEPGVFPHVQGRSIPSKCWLFDCSLLTRVDPEPVYVLNTGIHRWRLSRDAGIMGWDSNGKSSHNHQASMAHDIPFLYDLLLVILFSLPVLLLFRRLGLSPVAGFIAAGILIGPHGLGLVQSISSVEIAAEIGIVLLLFMVGLELSLSGLAKTPWRVYLIAVLQVLLTSGIGFAVGKLLGLGNGAALVSGFALAVSSSAIVLKGLADKGEIQTPLGRGVVAVCVVQDFAIVPMMLVVSILVQGHSRLDVIGGQFFKVLVLVTLLYLFGRFVLPALMNWMVGMRSREIFLLFTILILLGTTWVFSLAGLSLALGAFAAGLILSENEYSAQVLAEVLPFHSLFSSLFFVSIGMMLNLEFVMLHLAPLAAVAFGVILLKMLIIVIISMPFGFSLRESLQGGLYLAQIGEFSFLLMSAAVQGSIIESTGFQYFIAASSLSLAVTPLIMQLAPHIAWYAHSRLKRGIVRESDALLRSTSRPHPAVLIVGYGVNGRNVACVLQEAGIHHEILEYNPKTVAEIRNTGEIAHYGDVTRPEVLRHIRLDEFDSVVLAIADAEATRRGVSIMRDLHPELHILARTRFVTEVEELQKLGADSIVPEEFETSLRLFAELLAHYHIPPHIIALQTDLVRRQSYGMLRSQSSRGELDREVQSLLMKRLIEAVPIVPDSKKIGSTLGKMGFEGDSRCMVVSVIRGACPLPAPYEQTVLQAHDLV